MVKDDGLAAGKGVVVTTDRLAARDHAAELLETGHPVLLESFLDGPEVSLFCLVDGETVIPLLPAQDHKRVGDGDSGPNTGGMGAYTPLPWLPDEMVTQIVDDVVKPVAAGVGRTRVAVSPAFSTPVWRSVSTARPSSNSTAGSVTPKLRPCLLSSKRRWAAYSMRPRPERSIRSVRCSGATVPLSRS